MAKVKKMAFGGMGNIVKNVAAGAKKAVNRAAPPAQINSLSQLRSRPVMALPTTRPVVGKKDAFYSSPEYKGFQKDSAGKPATMDVYNSPYFGSVGSGSVGRAQDAAYRKYKGIAEPTPVMGNPVAPRPVAPKRVVPEPVMGNPVMPGIKTPPPGSIGFRGGRNGKTMDPNMFSNGVIYPNQPARRGMPAQDPNMFSNGVIYPNQPATGAPNTFAGALLGGAAPNQPVMGNNIGKPAFPTTLQSGMKKGGKVSSASKRADGIAQRGKTRA